MKRNLFLSSVLTVLVLLAGCVDSVNPSEPQAIGNPTPKDYLKYEDADIFLLNGIVHSNMEDVDWVQELAYTLGEEIGEITKQTDSAQEFENGTSNKLPVGTKIYRTDTPLYIAIVDGKEIRYMEMIEG